MIFCIFLIDRVDPGKSGGGGGYNNRLLVYFHRLQCQCGLLGAEISIIVTQTLVQAFVFYLGVERTHCNLQRVAIHPLEFYPTVLLKVL